MRIGSFHHLTQLDSSDKVCFISPEVSQFLKLVDQSEVSVFVEPLQLDHKELVVLPVNNAVDPSQPGGSHWSLLLYSTQANQFFHLDSSGAFEPFHF